MDYLGREWEITPAGGATGEAFIARHDEQKLFLKSMKKCKEICLMQKK